MSANIAPASPSSPAASTPAPKRITNAQTVCNERNEKNKLCNGHLKQLRTAGEASEVHLRGDDVLSKCQICGTLYMGPPLGHVRDPEKQSRFVEAELSALLQAAGGTLPVIEKNDKGVFVIVEPGGGGHGHAAPAPKSAAAAPAAVPAKPAPAAAQASAVAEKATAAPSGPKPAAQPDRQMNRRTSYAGFVDTGPVPGETKEQKIERLTQLAVAAKQRSDEGGAEHPAAAEAQAETGAASAVPLSDAAPATSPVAGAEVPANLATDQVATATAAAPTTSHASTGEPDRSLFRRSTYAGFVDTGPVSGETHEQKIDRLTKLAAAAKQKSEEGG